MITLTARPQNFRLENRSENRSHRNEMPGNGKIQKKLKMIWNCF